MENIKRSLTKGITALNVKTNNFMEESKCKTYISTLENEIRELQLTVGKKYYEKWQNGEEDTSELEESLQLIQKKYQEIQAQEERIRQLQQEEEQILGKTVNQTVEESENIFCAQCGAQNATGYKFCCKCGVPLK